MEEQQSGNGGCTGKGFRPGRSGNPAGASRRQRDRGILTAALREAATPEAAQAIVASLIARAQDGDTRAAEMVFDRLDGPVPKDVRISGQLGLAEALDLAAQAEEDGDADAV